MKTHIRDSEIRNLSEKVRKRSYNKYLSKVRVENLRVFEDATISFDFPITAIIGSNGSGKTTLMTASACVYQSVKPSDFFTKSSLDTTLQNAKIRFEIIDKKENPKDLLKASISHKKTKWDRRNMYERAVKYFGIKRTLPPTEQKELVTLKSKNIQPTSKIELTPEEVNIIQRILEFDSQYTYYAFEEKDLFMAVNIQNKSYSEFHFGAGESSIARLVYEMERLPDNALVLIEEIENGLHPSAVVRLVEYLFDVCERKRHQVIFTTHSNYAIEHLPNDAVWHCHNGNVSQGKINIEALRVMVGEIETQLVVFTEDEFAKNFITTTLRQSGATDLLNLIEIHPIGGKNEVIRFVDTQNENPATRKIPAVGILDGDVQESEFQKSKFADFFIKLPGDMPEKEVWDFLIREKLEDAIVIITLKLGLRIEQQNYVKDMILETNREVLDTHLLYVTLGKKLAFMSASVVENAFITTYVDYKNGSLAYIRNFLEGKMPN